MDANGHFDLDLDLLADSLPPATSAAPAPAAAAAAPPVAASALLGAAAAASDDQVLFASPAKWGSAGACSPGSPLSLALSGVPDALPAAGAAGWASPAWQPQHEHELHPQHVVGAGVAGEYARLAALLEQLDLRRMR